MDKYKVYDICIEVINKLSNGIISSYICPICGNLFDRNSIQSKRLTAEDVPPKSIGGRQMILTCKRCNNDLGSKLDSQIKNYQNFIKSVKTISTGKGHLTHKVKYQVNGYEANAICKMNNSKININFQKKINNPINITRINEFLESQTKSENNGFEFNISPNSRFHIRYFDIALLKNAYLIIFAKLGYTYIFHENYKIIRNQIINYDKKILKNFVIRLNNDYNGFNLFISKSPFKAILVQINNALVVLPTITSKNDLYAELSKYIEKKINFESDPLIWPKEIELENDYFVLKYLKNDEAILKLKAEAS
ncbi:MAG: HNH endonuclease [Candidatus Cloacimonadota bacterium]|nr:HNH endonuclease [Candidatus Cloacimonadota bacterium]